MYFVASKSPLIPFASPKATGAPQDFHRIPMSV